MVRCPNCGAENPEGSAFCGNCGTPLTTTTTTKTDIRPAPKAGLPLPLLLGGGALGLLVILLGGFLALRAFTSPANPTPTLLVLLATPTQGTGPAASPAATKGTGTTASPAATQVVATLPTNTPQTANTPAPANTPPPPTLAPTSTRPAATPTSVPNTPTPVATRPAASPTVGQNNPPTATPGGAVAQINYAPVGQVIYSDTFDNNKGNWLQPDASLGSVTIKDGQLHIVDSEADSSVKTWPQVIGYDVSDFVYEADVTRVSGTEDYPIGLVYRLNANNDYYLFGIYPDGSYYVARHTGKPSGNVQEWTDLIASTTSPAVKKGNNVANKLKVVTRGSETSFYVNDQYVNRLFDDGVLQGSFGFLVGNGGIEAAFDNLKVTGNTVFYDNFQNNNNGWIEVQDSRYLQNGEYHLINNREQNIAVAGYPQNGAQNLTDFVYEANIKLVEAPKDNSSYEYGILFRNQKIDQFYYFGINSTGKYFVSKLIDGKFTDIVNETKSDAIKTGAGAVNKMRVSIVGNAITAYVNNQQVATVNDDSIKNGSIGIWDNNSGVHISVSSIHVWTP